MKNTIQVEWKITCTYFLHCYYNNFNNNNNGDIDG